MDHLRFNLNGEWIEESRIPPTMTLLRYLRDVRGASGTKEGCAEGDCGACTVILVERTPEGRPVHRAVNSCLLLMPMVQGKHVLTIEALQGPDGELHATQHAVAEALGSQCGYCTPGVVMSLFEAGHREDFDAPWKVDDQLCGNLCRCTGYRPIREAAMAVGGRTRDDRFGQALATSAPESMKLDYTVGAQRYVAPSSLSELWPTLAAMPDARLVAGGTDLGLEVTKQHARPPRLVSLEGIPALRRIEEGRLGYRFGSGVTVSEIEAFTEGRLAPLHRMTRYFGSRQVKHRATVGGNLCNASPIGDLAPVLISLGTAAVLISRGGERRLPLEDFFVAYRKTALAPGEILGFVEVPRLAPTTRAVAYKVSKRRELDISAVSAGFLVEVDEGGSVSRVRLAFGGMAATPRRAHAAEAALKDRRWTREHVEEAVAALAQEFTPLSDHRGSAQYRALVAGNLLRGFFEETLTTPQPALKAGHAGTVQVEVSHG